MKKPRIAAQRIGRPSPTPTPMPALAPVERGEGLTLEVGGRLGMSVGDGLSEEVTLAVIEAEVTLEGKSPLLYATMIGSAAR